MNSGSDIRKFATAFVEAAAPELREALHGRETDEERFKHELEYQLTARGLHTDTDREATDAGE